MSFVSINEIESFRYDDCYIIGRKDTESDMVLEVKALIVKGDNSQNANFTDSYADVAQIIFKKGSIVKGIKDGIKRYDADGKLIEEIEDVILDNDNLSQLCNNLEGMYLQEIERVNDTDDYVIFTERASDETYETFSSDTYQIKVHCDGITIRWDRYLNRVEQ